MESGRIVILHKIRQSDIAAMAGVARENVSRTLTELKRRGLIGQSSSYYFINDKQKLLLRGSALRAGRSSWQRRRIQLI